MGDGRRAAAVALAAIGLLAAAAGAAGAKSASYANKGRTELPYGATLDFDKGRLGVETIAADAIADVALITDADGREVVAPQPRVFLAMLGERRPDLRDCLEAQYTDAPVPLHRFRPARYFCVRTNEGRVAAAQVLSDPERGAGGSIKLAHRTYALRLGTTTAPHPRAIEAAAPRR